MGPPPWLTPVGVQLIGPPVHQGHALFIGTWVRTQASHDSGPNYASTMSATLASAINLVQLRNLESQAANALHLNELFKAPTFEVNQQVLLFTKPLSCQGRSEKLTRTWKGPYTIQ
ncbi:hypothetical protein PHYBLDRAFT_70255 [Phycomyces blakesleeanus NRRL 1555(-)]|uniref:Uncharacterized protein n=1 Tax=Phycomyces blakesleeanus (strain ATCC 8743b / DSM 1359 / FGSC 10004 / NBRC 33097 / NRRL 1555) TaxID=763407 RepID=A0A162N8B6_PHYB8|nr:hypothetical protein PHYBLDRAFT_70255 [Phycomyces blakesleeanus NRRL 1555(-)]OAD66754.1 hypothetical protein PHYBLDRAFT_70255 [Phycomyces blakesleeanus NRRL 1555(-)]|eukprot:XP_018284794.1 hypothetical protein PHYBLDRAFT_70255 [Phycomyces blakesleeanus NRRL 1555(-)]